MRLVVSELQVLGIPNNDNSEGNLARHRTGNVLVLSKVKRQFKVFLCYSEKGA